MKNILIFDLCTFLEDDLRKSRHQNGYQEYDDIRDTYDMEIQEITDVEEG